MKPLDRPEPGFHLSAFAASQNRDDREPRPVSGSSSPGNPVRAPGAVRLAHESVVSTWLRLPPTVRGYGLPIGASLLVAAVAAVVEAGFCLAPNVWMV